jgi:hypothetical protein
MMLALASAVFLYDLNNKKHAYAYLCIYRAILLNEIPMIGILTKNATAILAKLACAVHSVQRRRREKKNHGVQRTEVCILGGGLIQQPETITATVLDIRHQRNL